MSLKVSGNSAVEAAVTADQLAQGEIGKVVTVDSVPNAYTNSLGRYIVRCSKWDAEGGVLMAENGPRVVKADYLHHYHVVRMPKGFVLTLEVA